MRREIMDPLAVYDIKKKVDSVKDDDIRNWIGKVGIRYVVRLIGGSLRSK